MKSATVGSTTTNYVYNALGQRVEKIGGPAGTVFTVYDEGGHLLGEYNGAGALIQETVWLGDTPVATIQPSGSSVAVYYIHADHLNAPRMITQPSTNTIVWRWDTDPFGTVAPNQNPAGFGTFVYNLRYPGQYYDVETGLNYNYFRDYDPQTGRYVESDPMGLKAGVNTYTYVGDSPIIGADPRGLEVIAIGHVAASPLGYLTFPQSDHLALYLNPDDKCQCPGKWPMTVGGQQMGGKLVRYFNYPKDSIQNSSFQQVISTPPGMSDCQFIQQLIQAALRYDDSLPYTIPFMSPFGMYPSGWMPGSSYNSNSFVSGVLNAAGASAPAIQSGGAFQVPGYGNPIPISH
jgi:RHS repeat-associated protein